MAEKIKKSQNENLKTNNSTNMVELLHHIEDKLKIKNTESLILIEKALEYVSKVENKKSKKSRETETISKLIEIASIETSKENVRKDINTTINSISHITNFFLTKTKDFTSQRNKERGIKVIGKAVYEITNSPETPFFVVPGSSNNQRKLIFAATSIEGIMSDISKTISNSVLTNSSKDAFSLITEKVGSLHTNIIDATDKLDKTIEECFKIGIGPKNEIFKFVEGKVSEKEDEIKNLIESGKSLDEISVQCELYKNHLEKIIKSNKYIDTILLNKKEDILEKVAAEKTNEEIFENLNISEDFLKLTTLTILINTWKKEQKVKSNSNEQKTA
ncbi:hypothetical protein CP985_08425 [Malaciobacter mytili LMG 24559]|uniref:Uncharacterized protein n=1 Tax=Malaciobacter mytili LMG 24559 TaxID=1032238 RepID=A0AAX2AGG1_9BACT|nr:hypothetical protein [Malaciobacter mytili]AXH16508.1 hypothetical protein AMYT_a0210 [Malaciobacter mytili LMG 24559]RXK15462.1 hypothetical protein CP985_08425 [Malaciobacter mytili LMG 24559]